METKSKGDAFLLDMKMTEFSINLYGLEKLLKLLERSQAEYLYVYQKI